MNIALYKPWRLAACYAASLCISNFWPGLVSVPKLGVNGRPQEKFGTRIHSAATQEKANEFLLSAEERNTISRISEASRNRDWQSVLNAFCACPDPPAPIYNAAMFAALKTGKYGEGFSLYCEMSAKETRKTNPTYIAAIKLCTRLGKWQEVDDLWLESESNGGLTGNNNTKLRISAMIDAAASRGNVTQAATFLDIMVSRNIDPDVPACCSALNACKNAMHAGGAVAFLKSMRRLGLPPNDIAYSTAMMAHRGAPLTQVLKLASNKSEDKVPDTAEWIEAYWLSALGLQNFDGDGWSAEQAVSVLSKVAEHRLHLAASIISKAESDRVRITRNTNFLKRALAQMGCAATEEWLEVLAGAAAQ